MIDETFERHETDDRRSVAERALEIAMRSDARIERHERTCDADRVERRSEMKELRQLIEAVKSEVSRTINKGLVWFVGILVVIVAYFLIRYGLTGQH